MALDDDIRILSGVPLFEGFAAEPLRLLAFGAERARLARGETLFREGDSADSAFVLVSGLVELSREEGGRPVPLGNVRPGALIGEFALIAETQRPTDARAGADSTLLRLERRAFRRVLEEYPELAVRLRDRVMREFQELVRQVEALGRRLGE